MMPLFLFSRLLLLTSGVFVFYSAARTPLSTLGYEATGTNQQPPGLSIHKLDNGLTLIIQIDRSSPLTAVEVWIHSGSADEAPNEQGAAHLLEHMLFKGSKSLKPGEADLALENLGSSLQATTSKDWIRVNTVVASRFLKDALPVVAELVLNPTFPAGEVETERSVLLDELASASADPVRTMMERLEALAYGSHPYGRPIPGTRESVAKLTRQSLLSFHRRCFVPANMTVVIVGDVESEEAIRLVKKYFGAIKGPPVENRTATPQWISFSGDTALASKAPKEDGGNAVWFGFAFPAPGMINPKEVLAMDVLHALLDLGPGGRLPRALVSTGLVRSLDVEYTTRRQHGVFTIIGLADRHRLEEVKTRLWDELERARTLQPSASELGSAQRRLLTDYAFKTETVGGRAYFLGFHAALGSSATGADYLNLIRKVTPEDVRKTAAAYLTPEKAVLLTMEASEPNG
ncbi:MAG: M16 family metallopeptidase [Armatimonadota bacterium]